jgi:hypothetical protein
MTKEFFILLAILILLWLPPIYKLISITYYQKKFERSQSISFNLGYLLSINGPIRIGKTSYQSGLKHIYEIEIQMMLQDLIEKTRKIFNKINFNELDSILDQEFSKLEPGTLSFNNQQTFDDLTNLIVTHYDHHKYFNLRYSIIFNFTSNKKTYQYLEDYVFAYFVLNYRKNYVMSKTPFYSHVTGTMSYIYDIEQTKIHKAYELRNYAIYDYMIELIDEASDEIGANKRFEDVKEEDGDKDYRRKFGQIHQERNRQITTKQDVKDEKKKLRSLTQSNLWLPERVEQRGTSRFIIKAIEFVLSIFYFFYNIIMVRIPFIFYFKTENKMIKIVKYIFLIITIIMTIFNNNMMIILFLIFLKFNPGEEYLSYYEYHYKRINIKRTIDRFVLHIDWYLFSIGYNKYIVLNYYSEEDVKKRDPMCFEKLDFIIPIIYCFGTYDSWFYKTIQKELLNESTTQSKESNWFKKDKYFVNEEEKESDSIDDYSFE